jgi:hypothetical protein
MAGRWPDRPSRLAAARPAARAVLCTPSEEAKPVSFKQPHFEPRLRGLAARPRECYPVPLRSGRSATPRGEQGMPGARRARSRACSVESTRVSHHGHAGSPGIPRAMVLTVSSALSSVTGLVCHRRQRNLFRQLDASVGASGPHDFAVRRQHRPSSAPPASTASRPYVRDVAQRPSEWGGTGRDMQVIWVRGQEKFGKSEIDRL